MGTQDKKIPVKKDDGSVVYMTLAELRAAKKGEATPASEMPSPGEKKEKASVQEKEDHHETPVPALSPTSAPSEPVALPTKKEVVEKSQPSIPSQTPIAHAGLPVATTPNTHYFEDMADAAAWDAEDHKSLLDEDEPNIPGLHRGGEIKHNDLDAMIQSLSFQIPADMKGRLSALVTSRQKGIRTDDQFLEYLIREQGHGGLNLSEQQAQELLRQVIVYYGIAQAPSAPPVSRKRRKEKGAEKERVSISPATHAVSQEQVSPPVQSEVSEAKLELLRSRLQETHQQARPQMHDVAKSPQIPEASAHTIVGPVDEIGGMQRHDFERLHADPYEAIKILFDKMEGLKGESFLTFLNGKKAWQRSPLFLSYQKVALDALRNQVPVSQILSDPNAPLTMQQFDALLLLNTEINQ